jgi:predicted phage terminase large subunit-like protein
MGVVRDHAGTLGFGLERESAEKWDTSNRGRYRAAGVGGAIAGTRADLVLIDDPTRSRADAESEVVRESQWAWFTGDLRTRLKPDAAIVVIMTRWHMDDLGGRLLDRQGDMWRVISLPAQAEDGDALGRRPGEWLWSDDAYGYGRFLQETKAEYERAGAMRDWSALFQQHPVAIEGSLFKVSQIETLDAAPARCVWARGWDLAATKQTGTRDPDWTAGVRIGRTPDGMFVVGDVRRDRLGPDGVEAMIVNTASMDGKACLISLPQDPGQAGKQQVLYLTRKLQGYLVESSPESGDKATRAAPVASQVNVGNLSIVRGPWNAAFLDELAAFPNGAKDDQVDALSRAFAMVSTTAPLHVPDAFLEAL